MSPDLLIAYACGLAAALLVGVTVRALLSARAAAAQEEDELSARAAAAETLPVQAVRQGVAVGAIAVFLFGAVLMAGKPGALLFFLVLCVAAAFALPGLILRRLARRRPA